MSTYSMMVSLGPLVCQPNQEGAQTPVPWEWDTQLLSPILPFQKSAKDDRGELLGTLLLHSRFVRAPP